MAEKHYGFLSSDSETVDENTLWFKFEVDVEGKYYLKKWTADVEDVLTIEDVYVDDWADDYDIAELRLIFEPMTLNCLKENLTSFAGDALLGSALYSFSEEGMMATRPSVIYTPVSAYKGREALRRAYGIVFGLSGAIKEVFRLFNEVYSPNIGTTPSTKQLDEVIDLLSTKRSLAMIDFDKEHPDQVKFRVFKGTIKPLEIVACAEFVNNIVEMANSDKAVVTFSDLLHGEYISYYIEDRKNVVDRFLNNAVRFGTDEGKSAE